MKPRGVFVSYRREDSGPYAGRLYDFLVQEYGHGRVFMDVDTLRPGDLWQSDIDRALARCSVVLAVIGPRFTDGGRAESRRIDDRSDVFRRELVSALNHPNALVIPVLVGGAVMPDPTSLPDELRPLAERQAWPLQQASWRRDAEDLVAVIEHRSASLPLQTAWRVALAAVVAAAVMAIPADATYERLIEELRDTSPGALRFVLAWAAVFGLVGLGVGAAVGAVAGGTSLGVRRALIGLVVGLLAGAAAGALNHLVRDGGENVDLAVYLAFVVAMSAFAAVRLTAGTMALSLVFGLLGAVAGAALANVQDSGPAVPAILAVGILGFAALAPVLADTASRRGVDPRSTCSSRSHSLPGLALAAREAGALSAAERTTADARFALRGVQAADGRIVILALDQESLRAFDAQLPISRARYAELLDRLPPARPRVTRSTCSSRARRSATLRGPDAARVGGAQPTHAPRHAGHRCRPAPWACRP